MNIYSNGETQMTKVFIDGSVGTTGLRIFERLNARKDLSLITLPEQFRKDADARKEAINSADVAFLCLPDAAAVEAVSFVENKNTAIIDTSTAHRTAEGWDYGFAELKGQREKIAASKRVANPGCHASGFIALVQPLVNCKIIGKGQRLDCTSITGYSGGGKKMIAEYESEEKSPLLSAPRMYGLSQSHKHLKEMKAVCCLESAPSFLPIVAPFYSGMQVTVSLFKEDINGSLKDIQDCYREYYNGGLVSFCENADEDGFMSALAYSGRDDMQVTVCGNDERIVLVSRFDNLGKGASGAAIQNMNVLLGIDEKTGLVF